MVGKSPGSNAEAIARPIGQDRKTATAIVNGTQKIKGPTESDEPAKDRITKATAATWIVTIMTDFRLLQDETSVIRQESWNLGYR